MDDTRILVKKAQNGDLDAFEKLVQRYQNRVYALSLHLAGNHEDAQDVAQEALIRAYRALDSFRNEADFGTWLHRITVNVWLNYRRKRGSQVVVSLDEPYRSSDGSEVQHELPSEIGDPLQALEEKEFRSLVHTALDNLNEEHRAVLVLREIEGYSYEEVAQILQCSLGTVKSRINRARQTLKSKLTDLAQDAGAIFNGKGKNIGM